MAEKGADFVGRFGREDVLELAGLLFNLGLAVEGEAVCEKPLRQAMASDDISCPLSSARREFND